jgi:hypothetical protein
MSNTDYRFTVGPLTEDEGGGYLIEFPDVPGCISDGEAVEKRSRTGTPVVRSSQLRSNPAFENRNATPRNKQCLGSNCLHEATNSLRYREPI